MTPADAQKFLEDNFAPWVLALHPNVIDVKEGGTHLRIPLGDHIARVGGIVSGQALATLADTSMVIAACAGMGELRPIATTNLDTQFLRPGVGNSVRAEARVVRAGKSLIFTAVDLIAEPSEKLIATATATFFRP